MEQSNAYIIDTTLRDGEQAPDVVFSYDEKLRIAEMLNSLGVDEVEAGTPAIGKEEQRVIKDIANAGFSFVTSCWCRATETDIMQAAKLGTQSINISLPVSDVQIETLGKTREWVIKNIPKMVSIARNHFPFVTLGAQDGSRADSQFLNEFINQASIAGAGRIRIADTVGLLDPMETNEIFSGLHKAFPNMQFEFHGHNDLGMATANAVAALKGGAYAISGTINGLGERAGNSVLEEVIAYLCHKEKADRFDTRIIDNLCRFIANISNFEISKSKPLIGKNAFRHESGIHTSAILKNIRSYQILDPENYGGGKTELSFGKHSGKASIIHFFENNGLPINESQAKTLLITVKHLVSGRKSPLSRNELLDLYKNINPCMDVS